MFYLNLKKKPKTKITKNMRLPKNLKDSGRIQQKFKFYTIQNAKIIETKLRKKSFKCFQHFSKFLCENQKQN